MAEAYRSLNLVEILEKLNDEDFENVDIMDIFIEPPEPNINSDEDSAEEDEGGTIDNLTSRQLSANAEVVLSNNQRIGLGHDLETPFDEMPVDLPSPCGDFTIGEQSPDNTTCTLPVESSSDRPGPTAQPTPTCSSLNYPPQTLRSVNDIPSTSKATGGTRKRKQTIQICKQDPSHGKKNIKQKTNQPSNVTIRKWEKGNFLVPAVPPFPESDFSKYSDFSPVELFELFFDEELFEMMLVEITRYASFKNVAEPNISKNELKCFLGILIVSGYNSLPGKRFYWETSDDVKNYLVSNSMRRNRFVQILSLLHFADNTKLDVTDKLWKIRPLIKKLKKNFRENFVPVCQLDFDESMIAYYGRHSCKQFLKGKPIRFGYKAWCLNSYSGYLVDFIVYQGKAGTIDDEYGKLFGSCAAPLVRILDDLLPSKPAPYHIYFDNLFTGLNLLVHLRKKNIHSTGTIRANRVPTNCKLILPKEMKKMERGYFDSSASDDNIIIVRWQDNAPVTVASTIHGVNPLHTVKRYSRTERKSVNVKRPSLIGEYNKFMGGTDLMDENVNRYRVAIRSKKWWWPIFSWLLDVSLQNAWYLYNHSRPKIPQLDFKRQIAVHYLKTYGTQPQSGGRPAARPQSTPAFEQVRFDGLNHLVVQNEENKKRRCAGQDCKSIIRTKCQKCSVGLCIPCFVPFHTKK